MHRQRLNEERRADVVFYRTPSLIEQKDQLLHQSSLVVHSSFEKMDKANFAIYQIRLDPLTLVKMYLHFEVTLKTPLLVTIAL